MRLQWSKVFSSNGKGIWPPDYQGLFVNNGKTSQFWYKDETRPAYIELKQDGITAPQYPQTVGKVFLPSKWYLMEHSLFFSEKCGINLNTMEEITSISSEVLAHFCQMEADEISRFCNGSYHFGDFSVVQRGNCSYACICSGIEKWRLCGQGYLYTPIIAYKNRHIFFGTDGNGGRFYLVDLGTGRVISEIHTGGTNQIIQYGDSILILQRKGRCQLLKVSLQTGQIEQAIDLPGVANAYSRIAMVKDDLYAVTFHRKNREPIAAIISSIRLR